MRDVDSLDLECASRRRMSHLIVCCAEIADPNWRWIEGSLASDKFRFQFVRCVPRNWIERNFKLLNLARLRGCFEAVRIAKRQHALVLVTHGPTLAAWCGVFGSIFGLKTRLLAHSFNFTRLPSKLKIVMLKLGLRQADRLVTFSRIEREVYSRAFNLPKDRFYFVYWGANAPIVSDDDSFGHYVSSIGGNARDYATLMDAARRLPRIPFIVVGRPENFAGLDLPQNVTRHVNTPLDFAMNLLKNSRFMVLPLNSSEVPCGHVTIVAAMHLGKAMVVTASSGVDDYVLANENALVSPTKDAHAMSTLIEKLWDDRDLCAQLGSNGKSFALENCSEQKITENFQAYLEKIRIL
jgi:glycosyltransferase involved in cell wall biosynthesis